MKDELTRILLIEDNPGDARLIREMVMEAGGGRFDLEVADRLAGCPIIIFIFRECFYGCGDDDRGSAKYSAHFLSHAA